MLALHASPPPRRRRWQPPLLSRTIITTMELSRVLALLAHDLRSPAAVIAGYSRMLREGRLTAEQEAVAEQRIEEAGARVAMLSQQAADLSQWMGPRADAVRQPVDLDVIISHAMARAGLDARLAVAPLPPRPPTIGTLDREALIGAVGTVLDLACRRSPDDAVRLAARPAPGADAWDILTGPGSLLTTPATVPGPEHGEPLPQDRGSSLALVVAEAVIAAHGGEIWTTGPSGEIAGIRLLRGLPS
jgi:signal transduction histidine kinase